MNYPLIDFGGAGPLVNVAPANGITPQTYLPMLQPVLTGHHIISLPPRALWQNQPVPETLGTWETDYARDLLNGLRAHQLTDVIGIGHSFGGIATALAALEDTSLFIALILLDPTILTRQILEALKLMRDSGTIGEDFPLAARALKRQRRFASREDAYAYFRPRGIFKDWDEAALRAYIDDGLIPDGDEVVLAWSPEWEAYYFKAGYTETWEMLPKLDNLLPTLILRGGDSDTYVRESASEVQRLLPHATHIDIPGHGHMFPQSAPAETGRVIADWLSQQGL
jgi:pimeloyl-ACP methyl ester carboxylesterase